MNFTSLFFLPLYGLTAALYPRLRPRHRTFLLLFSSWLFFLLESPASGLILFGMILLTFGAGLAMAASKGPGLKKVLLVTVLILCLGTLGLFKYTGLFFLPAGISFYTFQALSYTIDVYRGRFPAERDFPRFALYLSFFPQVVAGPIERPGDLLEQLKCERPVTEGDFRTGGFLMLRGYVRKIVIADAIAPAADLLFGGGAFTGPRVLMAALLFALQIYADFSGYSDIALGSARYLGIRLSENFREPYLAMSLRDFWRRWHMTLSRWLTDYVYIPLGGNRRGPFRTGLNTLLVFALSGIWHGRGLHFLVWGLIHGFLLLLEDAVRSVHSSRGEEKTSGAARFLMTTGTFLTVSLLWILFRAPDLSTALAMYRALPLGWGEGGELTGWILTHRLAFVRMAAALPLLFLLRRVPDQKDVPPDMKALAGGYLLFVLTLVSLFLNLQSGGAAAFIYFQF